MHQSIADKSLENYFKYLHNNTFKQNFSFVPFPLIPNISDHHPPPPPPPPPLCCRKLPAENKNICPAIVHLADLSIQPTA